ncbi:bifunctional RNase H/acid phosphatase [Streptomyces sp. YU58]|uniref:bifunctional RNase H/acid phosphatase n=1 Tax=Streptomyces sp. SX92 TaxID=3158972 RepID=UPI0027B99FDF|nr:bifunctional RNase H/acid phosphatase [Streptomyces coralus]WLW55511.1 bifunctional RNase H/acid phosphatase [Streptomyces coralus]
MREFIVEADGGSRGNPGPAGYGSVVLDAATGQTLAEAAEYLGVATNNVAEYRGLLAGLRAAHALDPTARIHVRMDSKLVVEQMSGRWKIKHPDMKPLALEAASVFPASQVTYEWIPRERNKHADRLANEAMDAGKRGERWSATASTAELDTRAARAAEFGWAGSPGAARAAGASAAAAPEPYGPPGDAVAGAARVRAALADGPSAADHSASGAAASGDSSPTAAAPALSAAVSSRRGAAEKLGGGAGKADADVRAARTVASPGWSAAPDMSAPATFVLLRHGETPLTPEKRFSGSGGTDPSLSEIGRGQAERAAVALARRGTIQHIVASPLARTRETAAAIATRLGIEVTVDEGLRETDFGAWEGLTFGEVRERYPDDLNTWLADPEAEPTGGGESFAAAATRIAATRDKLVAAYAGRTVLLVTHVTPIKTFVRLALGAPPESLFRMELSAASLSVVAYYADGNASVRLLNDTSHLR